MIYLLRHGKPDVGQWGSITATQFGDWIHTYNHCPLDSLSRPSLNLLEQLNSDFPIICSDTRRSIDSARVLTANDPYKVDRIFREFDLPYAHGRRVKLHPDRWALLFRLAWFFGYHRDVESFSEARLRVVRASLVIRHIHDECGNLVLVGHGLFNRVLAGELRKNGWAMQQEWSSGEFWSCVSLSQC